MIFKTGLVVLSGSKLDNWTTQHRKREEEGVLACGTSRGHACSLTNACGSTLYPQDEGSEGSMLCVPSRQPPSLTGAFERV